MTLTQLRYVIAIANAGSMNEAARTLFISQPSLSSAVKRSGRRNRRRAFQEKQTGDFCHAEGEEFLGYARQVVEQYELMESKYFKEAVQKKFSVST